MTRGALAQYSLSGTPVAQGDAVVGDAELDLAVYLGRGNGDATAVGHRFDGIEQQVQQQVVNPATGADDGGGKFSARR